MRIASKVKDYEYIFIERVLEKRDEVLGAVPHKRAFHFIDAGVYDRYGDTVKHFVKDDFSLVIEATEQNKSYLKLADYYDALVRAGFQRTDVLLTIGGGVLQDISGFIASTLYRGLKWIYVPTTLLAQADSCIGSKTSINLGDTKNLIGSFYPPDAIFIDVGFCETLTDDYFNSGMGEIIKYHLMVDREKFELLKQYLGSGNLRARANLEPIMRSSLEIKRSYFEGDEFDTGRRNLLNYGHTFGHALESASNFAVSHGEAVIVGMGFANLLSVRRGILGQALYDEFEMLLRPYYPKFKLATVSVGSLLTYLKRDKKRVGGDLTMILCAGLGQQKKYDDLNEEEIRDAYYEFCKSYPHS